MAPNPFKYASPLGEGDLFVDRQEEMEKILELISRAQPVAIYGERRIGKTSLLNRIGARLSDQRVAYISLEALRDEDEFLKWLAGVLGCKDWSTPIDLVPALEAQKPILLLDEFDKAALSDQFTSDFFHLLRAWASQGLIRLVIASARKPSELFSQSENITSPFYNIFYVIPILPLDADAARELLSPLDPLTRHWQSDWKTKVIEAVGRQPWELQFFGYRAWEALRKDPAAPLADLLQPPAAESEAGTPRPGRQAPARSQPAAAGGSLEAQWWKTLPVSVIAFLLAAASFLALGGALSGVAWLMVLAALLFFVVIVLILVR